MNHIMGWGDSPETVTLASLLAALIPAEEGDWQERALCAQTDPEAWYPEKGGSTYDAKRICLGCEVKDECLEYALAHDERFGVWGGLSERERRKLKSRGVLDPPTAKQVERQQRTERIRQLRQQGMPVPEVAALVGVEARTVVRVAPMSRRERKAV